MYCAIHYGHLNYEVSVTKLRDVDFLKCFIYRHKCDSVRLLVFLFSLLLERLIKMAINVLRCLYIKSLHLREICYMKVDTSVIGRKKMYLIA